jgi:anti-sigma regulatory factor (Ser/Thr protein kinase)
MPSDHRPGLVEVGHATVPCGPLAPSLARTAVARWLDSRGDAELVRDACLLVSELVTNSTRHAGQPAGAPVQIRASTVDGVVRIEVEDRGHGAVCRRAADPLTGGFGLNFVDTFAARWGVIHEHGTLVWFELAAGRSGPSPVPAARGR